MKYEGYDRQKKCLRYSHDGKTQKIYISHDERVFLPIARDSKKFKRIYKGRTSVERLNGRLDRDYMFEEHCIRGIAKMTLMVSLSMIIMNGMAIGKHIPLAHILTSSINYCLMVYGYPKNVLLRRLMSWSYFIFA